MMRGIFVDRDGTLNKMIGADAPFKLNEFELFDYTIDSLKRLDKDYHLFLITNQSSWRRGESQLIDLINIDNEFRKIMLNNKIYFRNYFICWHERMDNCDCIKPNSIFPVLAQEEYNLDFSQCWFVGDQDNDVLCGQKYGMKTILINYPNSVHKRGKSNPDYFVENLKEAIDIICQK